MSCSVQYQQHSGSTAPATTLTTSCVLQIVYYDGQFDDSRLCVALACTAALAGAAVTNHTEATKLLKVQPHLNVVRGAARQPASMIDMPYRPGKPFPGCQCVLRAISNYLSGQTFSTQKVLHIAAANDAACPALYSPGRTCSLQEF